MIISLLLGMLLSQNSGQFQVACLRFLNKFVETARSMEQKVFLQYELQEAGLNNPELDCLMLQSGQGNDLLREEIARWDENLIDVSLLVNNSRNMRRDLQQASRELELFKQKCKVLEEENVNLKKKFLEAEAVEKDIWKPHGSVTNDIETGDRGGNDDEAAHEAINPYLIDTDTVDSNRDTHNIVTFAMIASLEQSDDQVLKKSLSNREVSETTHCEDNRKEVSNMATPFLNTTSSSEKKELGYELRATLGNTFNPPVWTIDKDPENAIATLSEDFDSGTLMRDASQEETVLIEAVTISSDQFDDTNLSDCLNNRKCESMKEERNLIGNKKDTKEYQNTGNDKSYQTTNVSERKRERKLPKTPIERKSSKTKSFSFDSLKKNLRRNECKENEESEADINYNLNYGTIDTVSTKSFGFSRPSNTFIRKERDQRMQQCRVYFSEENIDDEAKEKHLKAQTYKNITGGKNYRIKEHSLERSYKSTWERRSNFCTLSRSKSLDIFQHPTIAYEQPGQVKKVRGLAVGRTTSNVAECPEDINCQTKHAHQEDWRRHTPFIKTRRRGRSENRTVWGIDGKDTLIMGTRQDIQNQTHINQAINSKYLQPTNITQSPCMDSPVKISTGPSRHPESGRSTSPTPSQASTNTVVRVSKARQNILQHSAGLY